MGPAPLGGSWKKKKGSRTLGSPITGGEISRDRKGASEAQRRVQQPVCGRQTTERPTQIVCATTLRPPVWDVHPLVPVGAGCWNSGCRGQTRGEDWCWLSGESLRGWSVAQPQTGVVEEEAWARHRSIAPLISVAWGDSLWLHAQAPCGLRESTPQPLPWPAPAWASSLVPAATQAGSHANHHLGRPPEQMPAGCPCTEVDLNHSGAPAVAWLRKQSWNLSLPLHELRVYTSGFVNSAPVRHLNGQWVLPWLGRVWP